MLDFNKFEKQEDIPFMVKLYREYKDHHKVAKELGKHPSNVARDLRYFGEIVDTTVGKRLTKVQHNPFEGQESTYWLGVLATDGYIDFKRARITLALKDEDHIKKFIAFIGTDLNINKYTSLKYPDSTMYRVAFINKVAFEYLVKCGFCEKKTFEFEYKLQIDSHFVRGIFDGDGCITYANGGKQAVISIVGASLVFMRQISRHLKTLNIHHTRSTTHNKAPLYILRIATYSEVLKFLKYIYKDANFYLERKKLKCLDIAKAISEKSSNSVNQR